MQLDALPKAVTVPRVFLIFILELVALHLALLRPSLRPSPRRWTTIQYLSLCLALLGLLSAVGSSRQAVSKGMLPWARNARDLRFQVFEDELQEETVDGGLLCRRFVRSAYSPPPEQFDRTQRDYDEACSRVRVFARSLPKDHLSDETTLAVGEFKNFHSPDEVAEQSLSRLRASLDEFNSANSKVNALTEATQNSELEEFIPVLTPYTLALALALQFWKTSAERWFQQSDAGQFTD